MSGNVNFTSIPGPIIDLTVSYLAAKDQTSFSFVNKFTYSRYSNDPYFKELFTHKYPYLKEVSEKLFRPIIDFHSSCSWKIINCVFPAENIRVYKIPPLFFESASSSIKKELNAYPVKLLVELNTICGGYYQDPSSPIDQAHKELNKCKLEVDEYRKAHNDFYVAFQEKHDANPQFFDHIESIVDESEQTKVSKNDLFVKIDERFAQWEDVEQMTLQLRENKKNAKSKYQELENRRSYLEGMQKLIPKELKKVESNPEYILATYRSICSGIFIYAKDYEAKQFVLSNLKQAIELMDPESIQEKESCNLDENVLKKIQDLINACSSKDANEFDVSQEIWDDLYNECANGAKKEGWVKEHVHEHLDALYTLLKNAYSVQEEVVREILNISEVTIAERFIHNTLKLEEKVQENAEIE